MPKNVYSAIKRKHCRHEYLSRGGSFGQSRKNQLGIKTNTSSTLVHRKQMTTLLRKQTTNVFFFGFFSQINQFLKKMFKKRKWLVKVVAKLHLETNQKTVDRYSTREISPRLPNQETHWVCLGLEQITQVFI